MNKPLALAGAGLSLYQTWQKDHAMRKPLLIVGTGLSLYGTWRFVGPWFRRKKRKERIRRELEELLAESGPLTTVPAPVPVEVDL